MSIAACLRASAFVLVGAVIACGQVTPGSHPQTVLVGPDQAGKTVQAKVGDTVRVTLQEQFPLPGSSLVWDVSSSAPEVLVLAKVTRDPPVRPQRGDVTYTADFKAVTSGQAKLMAVGHKTCEAMAKPGCPDQDFTITVQVQA